MTTQDASGITPGTQVLVILWGRLQLATVRDVSIKQDSVRVSSAADPCDPINYPGPHGWSSWLDADRVCVVDDARRLLAQLDGEAERE